MNHWRIHKDHVEPERNRKGLGFTSAGFPPGMTMDQLPIEFRLYDDDGNLYYEGRMLEEGFEPLDDFGMGYAGCTTIKTRRENGPWEIL